jgi:hypothetical protein
MMRLLSGIAAMGTLVLLEAFVPQERPQQERPGQGREFRFTPQQDSIRQARTNAVIDEKIAELKKSIAGQEEKPASEVFKNLQMVKGLKAGQIPDIMETWSHSLGTMCGHCHIVDQWAKDDKPEKQIARDMLAMLANINTKELANIKNLDSKNPQISCWTCHGGRVKPSLPPWERRARREG